MLDAFAMRAIDPYSSVVLAFNVKVEDDASSESEATMVKVINENVIYKIIDDYKEWLDAEKKRERDTAGEDPDVPVHSQVAAEPRLQDVASGSLRRGRGGRAG